MKSKRRPSLLRVVGPLAMLLVLSCGKREPGEAALTEAALTEGDIIGSYEIACHHGTERFHLISDNVYIQTYLPSVPGNNITNQGKWKLDGQHLTLKGYLNFVITDSSKPNSIRIDQMLRVTGRKWNTRLNMDGRSSSFYRRISP